MTRFWQTVVREWRSLRREPKLIVLAIAGPLLFAVVVAAVYAPKKVSSLTVTMVDQDSSPLSRDVARAVLATEPFVLGQYADSLEEFRRLAAEGHSHVCFVFPRGFERDIKAGRGAAVAVLIDGTNILAANAAANAASAVLATYSVGADIQSLERRGTDAAQAARIAMPIAQDTRSWFNPALNSNYANFMVLGMIVIPIQLSSMFAAARAGARELGVRPDDMPLPSRNLFVIAGAKCAVYIAILWPVSWLTIRIPQWWLGMPWKGSEWLLAAMVLWFVANMSAFGFAISCFVKDGVFASEICAAITMPNFLISGFTWPAFAMPRAFEIAAYALPMNPLALAVRKITMMGAGAGDLGREMLSLAAWSIVAGLLALAGAYLIRRHTGTGGLHP